MNIVLVILAAAVGIFFLSIAATCIYRAGYEKQIPKRLAEGRTADYSRKPMLSPFRFFWICITGFSILTLMFLSVTSIYVSERKASIYVSQCKSDGIVGMLDAQNEIYGYVRSAAKDNQFQFVYYLQDKNRDLAFPQILIYVESEGDEPFSYQYQLRDKKSSMTSEPQRGMSGWYAVNYEDFSGEFIFSCEDKNGSGSLEITMLQ